MNGATTYKTYYFILSYDTVIGRPRIQTPVLPYLLIMLPEFRVIGRMVDLFGYA